jgi:hypothetical protein
MGKSDNFLLNGVIIVAYDKIRGKNGIYSKTNGWEREAPNTNTGMKCANYMQLIEHLKQET